MIRRWTCLFATVAIFALIMACGEPGSLPPGAVSPSAAADIAPTLPTEQEATYAIEVLFGLHWDNPEARSALRAYDLAVVSVEQFAIDDESIWEVRMTGRFEIQSCPVRRLPTPGTRICDEGEHAVVRFRAIDWLDTTVEITTVSGTITFVVNSAAWIDPTPSS